MRRDINLLLLIFRTNFPIKRPNYRKKYIFIFRPHLSHIYLISNLFLHPVLWRRINWLTSSILGTRDMTFASIIVGSLGVCGLQSEIMISTLTKEVGFEIPNLHYKKILY